MLESVIELGSSVILHDPSWVKSYPYTRAGSCGCSEIDQRRSYIGSTCESPCIRIDIKINFRDSENLLLAGVVSNMDEVGL